MVHTKSGTSKAAEVRSRSLSPGVIAMLIGALSRVKLSLKMKARRDGSTCCSPPKLNTGLPLIWEQMQHRSGKSVMQVLAALIERTLH